MSLVLSDPPARLYRVEAQRYAQMVDEDGEPRGAGRLALHLRSYPVTSYTAKGAWINVYGEPKFVNLRAVKQWACGTVDDARTAFHHRKLRHIEILSAQLRTANEALVMNQTSDRVFP